MKLTTRPIPNIIERYRVALLISSCLNWFAGEGLHAAEPLPNLRTVVTSDSLVRPTRAPAVPIGEQIHFVLNDNGNVAFQTISGGIRLLFAERNGGLNFVISPDTQIGNLFFDNADVAVLDGYSGASSASHRDRIWKWSIAGLTQIAGPASPLFDVNGNPIPGMFQSDAYLTAVSPNGQIFFDGGGYAQSNPSVTTVFGFWHSDGTVGSVRQAFLLNQQVPGQPTGVRYENSTGFSAPKLNAHGHFAIGIELDGPTTQTHQAIVTDRGGSIQVLYRQEDQVPGQPSGVVFDSGPGNPVINNHDDIAFSAQIRSDPFNVKQVIFRDHDGQLDKVFSSDDSLATSRVLSVIGMGGIAMNADGRVAFGVEVTGPTAPGLPYAIVLETSPANITPIVVGHDPVPRGPVGAIFDVPVLPNFQLNDLGQVAFESAIFLVPGDGSTKRTGVFAYDPNLGLLSIALPGDLIQVKPGDVRQIQNAQFFGEPSGGEDGVPMALNNRGQILFQAFFTDGTSGLFVSNGVAVPEPSTIALAVIMVLSVPIRRRYVSR